MSNKPRICQFFNIISNSCFNTQARAEKLTQFSFQTLCIHETRSTNLILNGENFEQYYNNYICHISATRVYIVSKQVYYYIDLIFSVIRLHIRKNIKCTTKKACTKSNLHDIIIDNLNVRKRVNILSKIVISVQRNKNFQVDFEMGLDL